MRATRGLFAEPEAVRLQSEEQQAEVRRNAARTAAAARDVVDSDPGRVLMAHLRREYVDCPLFDPDPARLAYRVGLHDMVKIIEDAARKGRARTLEEGDDG